jgi:hypothetical protein
VRIRADGEERTETKVNDASVEDFLNRVPDATRARALLKQLVTDGYTYMRDSLRPELGRHYGCGAAAETPCSPPRSGID